MVFAYLIWSKNGATIFDYTVHCVCHRETMSPVMVGNPSIVLLDRQSKPYNAVLIKPSQPKQILKHEHAIKCFLMIVDLKGTEVIAIDTGYFLWNSDF